MIKQENSGHPYHECDSPNTDQQKEYTLTRICKCRGVKKTPNECVKCGKVNVHIMCGTHYDTAIKIYWIRNNMQNITEQ